LIDINWREEEIVLYLNWRVDLGKMIPGGEASIVWKLASPRPGFYLIGQNRENWVSLFKRNEM
jgi:hypothetical protein